MRDQEEFTTRLSDAEALAASRGAELESVSKVAANAQAELREARDAFAREAEETLLKVPSCTNVFTLWQQAYSCAQRPGAAASVSRRRRERRTLLAGGGRASRSHTLAASQAFERTLWSQKQYFFVQWVHNLGIQRYLSHVL